MGDPVSSIFCRLMGDPGPDLRPHELKESTAFFFPHEVAENGSIPLEVNVVNKIRDYKMGRFTLAVRFVVMFGNFLMYKEPSSPFCYRYLGNQFELSTHRNQASI
jgi:hypothetical protein